MADRQERGGARALWTLALGLIPVGATLLLVYASYVRWTTQYQVTRGYRALATKGREVTARIEGIEADFRTTAATPDKPLAGTMLERQNPCPSQHGEPLFVDEGLTVHRSVENGIEWLHLAGKASAGERSETFCARANLRAHLAIDDLPMFDDFVVADGEGTAILGGARTAGIVEHLPTLIQLPTVSAAQWGGVLERLTFTAPDAKGASPTAWTDAYKTPLPVSHLGRSYRLFCQPVRAPGGKAWAICGLRLADEMAATAWEVPPLLLVAVLCLATGMILAWPITKLRFMGQNERLRLSDVRILVLSCLAGVAIVTFLGASVYGHQSLTAHLDAESEAFGHELGRRLRTDICEAAQQLPPLRLAREKLHEQAKDLPCPADDPCPLVGAPVVPGFSALATIAPDGWVTSSCTTKGGAIVSSAPPTRPATERQYFKDVTAGSLWSLSGDDCPKGPVRVAVESIRTLTTGETSLAVAQPLDGSNGKSGVAVLVARFRSVIDPIGPPGLEFAVVDESGKVLLHSDRRRNLEENLIEETDGDTRLRDALHARRTIPIDVPYYGHRSRLVVQPIPETPWSVVVLRDKAPLDTVAMVTTLIWIFLFSAYFLALGTALAIVAALKPGYRAEWLWPDAARAGRYPRAIAALALALAVGIVACVRGGGLSDLCVIVGLPLASLAAVYAIVSDVLHTSGWRRALAVTTIGLASVLLAIGLSVRFGRWSLVVLTLAPIVAATPEPNGDTCSPRALRARFVALLVLLQLAVAAVPALVMFRDAREQAVEEYVKRTQLEHLRGRVARVERIGPERSPDPGVYGSSSLDTTPPSGDATLPCAQRPHQGWLATLVKRVVCGTSGDRGCADIASALERHPSAVATSVLPNVYPPGTGLQLMNFDAGSDGGWCWTDADSGRVTLRVDDPTFVARLLRAAPPLFVTATLPALAAPSGMLAGLFWSAAVLAASLLLAVLLRFVIVNLFLLDPAGTESASRRGVDGTGPRAWVHVRAGDSLTELLQVDGALSIDLRRAKTVTECTTLVPTSIDEDLVIVDHIETHLAADWSDGVAAVLEDLVLRTDKKVVLLSDTDVLAYLSEGFTHSEPTDKEGREVVDRFWRWVRILAACDTQMVCPSGYEQLDGPLAEAIAAKAMPAGGQQARYWRVWAHSTKSEKLAMRQLAHEGFLNPKAREVTDRLMRRGLVSSRPGFPFFEKGFRRFVLAAEPAEDILAWEQQGAPGWKRIRGLLFAAIVVVVGFFFLTQPDAYTVGMALLAAITTAVPRMLTVAGFFGKPQSESS